MNGIGAGSANELSVKELEQSRAMANTWILLVVEKVSCDPSGLSIMHWKQKMTRYPLALVSVAVIWNGEEPIATFVYAGKGAAQLVSLKLQEFNGHKLAKEWVKMS